MTPFEKMVMKRGEDGKTYLDLLFSRKGSVMKRHLLPFFEFELSGADKFLVNFSPDVGSVIDANAITWNELAENRVQDVNDDGDDDEEEEEEDLDPYRAQVAREQKMSKNAVGRLYQRLREAHFEHDDNQLQDILVQHDDLKATLTPYQADAVRWMLHRELIQEFYPPVFARCRLKFPCESELESKYMYYNPYLCSFLVRNAKMEIGPILIPSGGILADEMGLGKTVEFLALTLLNQRHIPDPEEPPTKRIKTEDEEEAESTSGDLFCFCGEDVSKKLIECIKCGRSQHRSCVLKHAKDPAPEERYICPSCWNTEANVVAKTTLIIAPNAIKIQWLEEIQKHISEGKLKVRAPFCMLQCLKLEALLSGVFVQRLP